MFYELYKRRVGFRVISRLDSSDEQKKTGMKTISSKHLEDKKIFC